MNVSDSKGVLLSRLNEMAKEAGLESGKSTEGQSFSPLLQQALQQVNNRQQAASQMAVNFETGQTNVNLSEVMIEMQKARVSFEALSQIRNKFVAAYQQVMSMPL